MEEFCVILFWCIWIMDLRSKIQRVRKVIVFTFQNRKFTMFIFQQNKGSFQHRRGVFQHRRGLFLQNKGKQGKIDPLFAPYNTLQTQNSHQSALFAPKTPCFGNFYSIYSYPTYIPTGREVFWCIWIMDRGSKMGRGGDV